MVSPSPALPPPQMPRCVPAWALFLTLILLFMIVIILFVFATDKASSGLRWGGLVAIIIGFVVMAIVLAFGTRTNPNCRTDLPVKGDEFFAADATLQPESLRSELASTHTQLEACHAYASAATNELNQTQQQLVHAQTQLHQAQFARVPPTGTTSTTTTITRPPPVVITPQTLHVSQPPPVLPATRFEEPRIVSITGQQF